MTRNPNPLALVFAALAFTALWVPTLTVPAAAQTAVLTLPALA